MWFAEILFQNFQIFHDILPNLENSAGGPISKIMQIPKKESTTTKTVRNHVKTVGTC